MTKITSTTTTQTATPSIPVDAPEPATKPKADIAPPQKDCAPESTPKDTWETSAKDEKSEGFFSKLGQKIDQTIDDAKTTVKNAGETVQKMATNAVNDGIDTIQQRANNTVDNIQQGIDNVQKTANDTVDALQALDAKTVKDIAVKHFVDEPIQAVKDVATAAAQAIDTHQEIKRQQNETLVETIRDTISYAPEFLQEVKQTTQSILEKTDKVLEQYTPQVIQDTRETIEKDQLGFLQSIKEIAISTPQAIAELKLTVSAATGQVKEKLITELMISASEAVADHVDTFRTAIDQPTLKEQIFIALKANTPEQAHRMLDAVSLVSGGFNGIIQTQIQAMARSTAHALVDSAVVIDKDPDAFRASKNSSARIRALDIDEEVFVESEKKLSIHAELGAGFTDGVSMVAKRDKNNPTDFLIEVSKKSTIFGGAGAEAAEKGMKADIGRKSIDSLTFRFDSNNTKDMQLMDKLVHAHKNGLSMDTILKALPGHLDEKSGSAGAIVSGSLDVGILTFSGEITALGTISQKRTDEGMETTLSAELGQINKAGTPRIQLPDNLGLLDQTLAPQNQEFPMQIYNAIMGNSSSLGAELSGEASIKVGFTFAENSRSLDDLKSIVIDVSGEVALSSNSASGTVRTEIKSPTELARHLKMSNQNLVQDLKDGSLTMENIADRLTSEGTELSKFIQVTVITRTAHEDAFALDASVFNYKSGTRSLKEKDYVLFPPEPKTQLDSQTSPQHSIQNDAAEANLRLLDRAFHA